MGLARPISPISPIRSRLPARLQFPPGRFTIRAKPLPLPLTPRSQTMSLPHDPNEFGPLFQTRRQMLQTVAGAAALSAAGPLLSQSWAAELKGRINHSVCLWCYGDFMKQAEDGPRPVRRGLCQAGPEIDRADQSRPVADPEKTQPDLRDERQPLDPQGFQSRRQPRGVHRQGQKGHRRYGGRRVSQRDLLLRQPGRAWTTRKAWPTASPG